MTYPVINVEFNHTVRAITGRGPSDSENVIWVPQDGTIDSLWQLFLLLSLWLLPSKPESPELNLFTRLDICSVCMGSWPDETSAHLTSYLSLLESLSCLARLLGDELLSHSAPLLCGCTSASLLFVHLAHGLSSFCSSGYSSAVLETLGGSFSLSSTISSLFGTGSFVMLRAPGDGVSGREGFSGTSDCLALSFSAWAFLACNETTTYEVRVTQCENMIDCQTQNFECSVTSKLIVLVPHLFLQS